MDRRIPLHIRRADGWLNHLLSLPKSCAKVANCSLARRESYAQVRTFPVRVPVAASASTASSTKATRVRMGASFDTVDGAGSWQTYIQYVVRTAHPLMLGCCVKNLTHARKDLRRIFEPNTNPWLWYRSMVQYPKTMSSRTFVR